MSRPARSFPWLAVSLGLVLAACTDRAAPAPPAQPAVEEAPQPPQPARYTLNEWGLIGVEAGALTARIGGGVSHPLTVIDRLRALGPYPGAASVEHFRQPGQGLGASGVGRGGKPVIYLHVPEGAPPVDVSVGVRLPAGGLLEHWPPGTVSERGVTWNVRATAGSCRHSATPPTADAEACRDVRDGFCEAAEIPRYTGHDDTCLRGGSAETGLLFYRAEGLDVMQLPLELRDAEDAWVVTRRSAIPVEGPVLYVERVRGEPRIHALTAPDFALPTGPEGSVTPDEARALLHAEALRRGLLVEEADAFVDAWAPAYFGTCRREGPVASGSPPGTLAEADRSLLYFASDGLVDLLLPLELTPAPEAMHRVFLVRYVDPASVVVSALAAGDEAASPGVTGTTPGASPVGARSAVRPRVEPERPTVEGALTEDVVRRVVLRHATQVRSCYEMTLARAPETAGRLGLALVITPRGTVGAASVEANTTGQNDLGVCVARALSRVVFPTAETPTIVRYGFALSLE